MRSLGSKPRATYADLEKVPETQVGEIIDGELIVSPRPALRHAGASSGLGYLLGGPFRYGRGGPGGWIILDEPELHLHGDALVPDLAGWRRTRLPELPDEAALELAPDWVCEVLSPSTARLDRFRKMAVYAREGVEYAWLIDPIEQSLEVRKLDGGAWKIIATHLGDEKVRAEPFDAIELELSLLWAR